MRDYDVMKKKAAAEKIRFSILLHDKLTGLAIKKHQIEASIREVGIVDDNVNTWDENLDLLITTIRKKSKPIVIVANKIDQPISENNFKKLENEIESKIFPVSALAEVFLRTEDENKTIKYLQGDSKFTVLDQEKLGENKSKLLTKINTNLLEKYGSTGVQDVLTHVVFNLLDMIVVYPVEDISKFADKSGNILPDAYLVPRGTTAIELAAKVHTDFAKNFIHGSLAPSGRRIGADYELQNNDIVKIVSAVK
jgi:ribosome-binding ATPase YchF (GTP1/OBG family)